ncbi:hypothetical protein SAY87_008723 [Trapa incisa]|uniref:Protein ABIL5 n=1 Tax=Trapa incisa TaxID=236973 RepID=A0AAN7PWA3_9MYRT|nr:hypothetical protein SAY87_008723 [Trapa incisa]
MAPEEGGLKESTVQQQHQHPHQQKLDGEEGERESASAYSFASATVCKSSDVAETEELIRFNTSLLELREISSQIHYAADYCESTFQNNSEDRKPIVDNTKEYICRAVVTMVDHLGNVSCNLTSLLSQASAFTDAELRINSLKQRIMSCEKLGSEFALKKVRWRAVRPRHHSRYLFTDARKPTIATRSSIHGLTPQAKDQDCKFDRDEGFPLFLYTHNTKPLLAKGSGLAGDSNMVPVRAGFPILSKGSNPTFHFQTNHKLCNGRNKKSSHSSDILSLMRRLRQMG